MSETFEDIMAGVLDDTPDIMVDPDMQAVVNRALEINDTLRTTSCTVEEMHAYVAELDALWEAWLKQAVIINATVYHSMESEEPEAVRLQGKTVYSDGFSIVVRPLAGAEHPQVVYDIKVELRDIFAEGDPALEPFEMLDPDDVPLVNAVATLDASISPTDFTSERALQYIELYHPELAAEIDRRILYTASSSEALLALRGLDLERYLDIDSDITKAAFAAYINSLISLDDEVPHEIMLGKGKVYAEGEDDDGKALTVTVDGEFFYAAMDKTIHLAERYDEEERRFLLAIDLKVLSDDHGEHARFLCVPIDTIGDIQSVRRRLFNK